MNEIEQKLRKAALKLLTENTVCYVIGWEATKFEDRTRAVFISNPADVD